MRLTVILIMIVMRVRCRFIVMAALVVIAMTVIKGADLSDAVAVTKVATHDAKHLRPTQREKREGNKHGVRASGHGRTVDARALNRQRPIPLNLAAVRATRRGRWCLAKCGWL